MDWECDVLMHAAIGPEDAGRVGVITLVRADAFDDVHLPLAGLFFVDCDLIGGPAI